jgi:hypothetical protein
MEQKSDSSRKYSLAKISKMYVKCMQQVGGNMPLLQVRDFPGDIYEEIKIEARRQHRTIAQQTIVLIKNGLGKENTEKEKRLQALERSRNRYVPEEVKQFDVVKSIHEDRNR